MLKNRTEYVNLGQDYYEECYRKRAFDNLKRKARQLGYKLIAQDDLPQKVLPSTG